MHGNYKREITAVIIRGWQGQEISSWQPVHRHTALDAVYFSGRVVIFLATAEQAGYEQKNKQWMKFLGFHGSGIELVGLRNRKGFNAGLQF